MRTSVFVVFALSSCLTAFADVAVPPMDMDGTWVETPFGEPVIDRGDVGGWDHMAVDNPFVYVEDGNYYTFYEGQDTPSGHEQVGLAISTNGTTWTKTSVAVPLLTVGAAGAWDGKVTKIPSGVIKEDGVYYLFFTGGDTAGNRAIGVARSTQLTGGWMKLPAPVLEGRTGEWDALATTYPFSVQRLDGRFCFPYRGFTHYYANQGLGLAVSDDLIHWSRDPDCVDEPFIAAREEMASISIAETADGFTAISQPMNLANRAYWSSADLKTWDKLGPVQMEVLSVASTISNPFLVEGRWNVLYEQDDRIYQAVLESDECILGDLDGDGFVGSGDLDAIRAAWGWHVGSNNAFPADVSGDGIVGSADLDIVRANWGGTAASMPETVPEPSLGMLVIGSFTVFCLFGPGWTGRF